MTEVEVWGGAGEYGRSFCYFVKNKETKNSIDCGINRILWEWLFQNRERMRSIFRCGIYHHIHMKIIPMGFTLLAKYGYKNKKFGDDSL